MNISALLAFWREEDGQDVIEYALLMAFIALAVVAVLSNVQTSLKSLWSAINSSLNNATAQA